jgi:hypothetical protein
MRFINRHPDQERATGELPVALSIVIRCPYYSSNPLFYIKIDIIYESPGVFTLLQ